MKGVVPKLACTSSPGVLRPTLGYSSPVSHTPSNATPNASPFRKYEMQPTVSCSEPNTDGKKLQGSVR